LTTVRLALSLSILLASAQLAPSLAQIPLSEPQVGVPASAPSSRGGGEVLEVPQRHSHLTTNAAHLTTNAELSDGAGDYLHHNRLPYVNVQVLVDDKGNVGLVVLTGQVHTEFGKQDAERKVRTALDDWNVVIRDQIEVIAAGTSRSLVHQGGELNLNPIFLACWRGTAPRPDTLNWKGGCPPPYFVAKTMELCVRKAEEGGFTVTFQSLSASLPNFRDNTELVSSDGRNRIDLLSVGTFDPGNNHAAYSTTWHCGLSESSGVLTCAGASSNECNGRLWVQYTVHIDLRRLAAYTRSD
jgi:hypothetical protein